MQGRQHTQPTRGLDAGLADAVNGDRRLRVVLGGDSSLELSEGFGGAWDALQAILAGTARSHWMPASSVLWTLVGDFDLDGTAGDFGMDSLGRVLSAGDAWGSPTLTVWADTIDVHYTARTSGGNLAVTIDGALADTIDTSDDEDGSPVASDTPAQRARFDVTAGWHTITLTASGGDVWLEGVNPIPDAGVEVHGLGRSGQSAAQMVSRAGFVAHVQAMTDRGEPPDVIFLNVSRPARSAPTPSGPPSPATSTPSSTRSPQRRRSPRSSHAIPQGLGSPTPTDWDRWAGWWRTFNAARDLVTVDVWSAVGHVGAGYDDRDLADDNIHLNAKGQAIADAVLLDVVASRLVRPQRLAGLTDVAIDDLAAVADGTIPAIDTGTLTTPETRLSANRRRHLRVPQGPPRPRVGLPRPGLRGRPRQLAPRRHPAPHPPRRHRPGPRHPRRGHPHRIRPRHHEVLRRRPPNRRRRILPRALTSSDRGKTLLVSAASTITLANIATSSWPVGAACRIVQTGAGAATVAAGGGQTLRSPGGAASTGQGQEGILRRIAATEWAINWI